MADAVPAPPTLLYDGSSAGDGTSTAPPSRVVSRKGPRRAPVWKEGDIELVHRVGRGSKGDTWLARCHDEDDSAPRYAVKVIEKTRVEEKEVKELQRWREISLSLLTSPHNNILSFHGTCQGALRLYIVFDFLQGGELLTHYRDQRGQVLGQVAGTMPAAHVTFYAAEATLALEHLHRHRIVYRNLRPETMLLGADGHLRLADLGHAKLINQPTASIVGVREYQAPEMFHERGYTDSVDWWSLGIVVFEMLAGYLPFFDESVFKSREIASHGEIDYPEGFDSRAKDLVGGLLIADPTRRLGATRRGVSDVKKHKFFASVDWGALSEGKAKPPLIPSLVGPEDTRFFDPFPCNEELQSEEQELAGHQRLARPDFQRLFEGF
eukprot:Hpha_TRINITY_DN28121_c0_g1::TRINITY_DN28121_c0_g1_i1::g.103223::m.103223/K19584/PRKX; protein kinase X